MPQEPLGKESRLSEKSTRTIFFLSAVLFHLVLFLAIAGWILIPAPPTPAPDPGIVNIPHESPKDVTVHIDVKTPPIDITSGAKVDSVITSAGGVQNINISHSGIDGLIGIDNAIDQHSPKAPHNPRVPNPDPDPRIKDLYTTVFTKWGMTPGDLNSDTPHAKFPVYIASYANGDWDCNSRLDKDGNIVAGSIPNLLAKISEWSHGDIKGELAPKPLNVASPELLDKMPPFIFFTGHSDFVLTGQEVENLRTYLNDGGMIWGDNALAGEGSRFDVAFHREMKRVIPDLDKKFVAYSADDKIFARGRYPLTEFPTGMNYYAEPPQHLDIGGVLAILYTPNDYGDMMFMKINPDDKSYFMTYKPIPPGTLFTNTAFVEKQSVFYRNFDLKSSLAVHHMGMDIVNFLLIRFRDKLQLPP